MSDLDRRITENLAGVRARIAEAAGRSGRNSQAITLVAVTKYVGQAAAEALIAAGCADLGESRPQELWSKAEALGSRGIRWHMIGHLQRNKLRRTLPLVSLIHSVDSPRLLAALESEACLLGQLTAVLLEVNISGDAAKQGFSPEEVSPLLAQAREFPHVAVRGLMCMAGLESDPGQSRRELAGLRELRDRLLRDSPPQISLSELSMGMSHDFEIAIEEGATQVRVGSALFEGVTT